MAHSAAKTILITGAGSGIGWQTALRLAERGHHVIATGRKKEQLDALQTEAKSRGLRLTYEVLDITSRQQAERLAATYQLDVVINNAAIGDTGPIAEVPLDRVRTNLEVNVLGTLRVIQAVLPQMIERRSGRIIVLSSMVGLTTPMFMNPYASTKAALESIANSLRNELKYFNIQTVLINPGRIDGGHNAEIAATKYDWLKSGSPYYALRAEMKRHDRALLDNAYPISSVVRAIVRAVEASRPKVRYAAPFKYRIGLVMIRLLPERLQDWAFFKAGRFRAFK